MGKAKSFLGSSFVSFRVYFLVGSPFMIYEIEDLRYDNGLISPCKLKTHLIKLVCEELVYNCQCDFMRKYIWDVILAL